VGNLEILKQNEGALKNQIEMIQNELLAQEKKNI